MKTIRIQIEELWNIVVYLSKIGAAISGFYVVGWLYFWVKETPWIEIFSQILLIIGTPIGIYLGFVAFLEKMKFRVTAYETPSPTEYIENYVSKPPIGEEIDEIPQSRGGRPRKVQIDEIYNMLVDQGVIPPDTEPFSRSDKEWEELYRYWKKGKKRNFETVDSLQTDKDAPE